MPMVGANVPDSMDAQTPESLAANATYEIFVAEALSRHAWSWATKTVLLTYTGETASYPRYSYSLPADILSVRGAMLVGRPFRDFKLRRGLFLCDLQDSSSVELVYNWRAPESEWPADFVDAMVDRLASKLATGLLDRPEQGESLDRKAEFKLRKAIRRDRRQYPGEDPFKSTKLTRAWQGSSSDWRRGSSS